MIPWESRKETGFFKAMWETIKEVLFAPGEFFQRLEIKDTTGEPLIFYVAVSTLTGTLALILDGLFRVAFNIKSDNALPFYMYPVVIIILPLILTVALYVSSAFMHLGALLFRGTGGFKGTLNILAYNAATSVFSVIPLLGGLISMVWSLVVGITGFKRVHNLTTLKAVFAYFIFPFIVVLVIIILAAVSAPGILRARLEANEAAAQAALKTISTAIEFYSAQHKGQYPKDEYELRFATPPYLNAQYDGKTISGYAYSLDLSPSGYQVTAKPASCGVTGRQVFTIKTQGLTFKEACRE